ncbi:type II toxin-antitoxin system VapC family toxin [Candidatus Woesearchaeota archaeon]|nr:type II toxin-antitoxin system VapC family toxin [Candidatus Woesearchaeota archaeon]
MTFADTTLLVDFLRGHKEAILCVQQLQSGSLFTSEINVYELIDGVYSGEQDIQTHLNKVFTLLEYVHILPFDRKAALKAGMISGTLAKMGKKIGEADSLIAGVALANGITEIISDNKEHFGRIPGFKVISYK